MPLQPDYSIVADSTISSSPQPLSIQREEHDFDASLQIKRPARTYGRRQDVVAPVGDAETPISFFPSSVSSRSTHHTAPPGLSEEIPPSSPRSQVTELEEVTREIHADGEESLKASKKYEFAWRRQLRDLEEDDGTDSSASASLVVPASTGFGQPFLLEDSDTNKKTSVIAEPTSRLPSACNIFNNSSLSKEEQPSSNTPSFHDSFVLSSPKVAPRKHLSKVVLDTDSEPELPKASSSTSPTSSQPPHINTPKSGSFSTTPPTSDDEMLGRGLVKGKRKAVEYTRDSAPLTNLIEVPLSASRTTASTKSGKTKAKPLTKKEEAEMAKERVRMAAGSNASAVIRRATVNKYTKKNLFANIGTSGRSMLPSDPIEPYSSPPGRTQITTSTSVSAAQNPRSIYSLPAPNDSDSDELPEVCEVIKPSEASSKKEELKRMKQRLLKQQKRPSPRVISLDNDDDGLEVVSPNPKTGVNEEKNRRSAQKDPISRTRQQQFRLAQINMAKHKSNDPVMTGGSGGLGQSDRLSQETLSRILAAQALKAAQAVARKKAEHWEKHGGYVANRDVPAAGLTITLQTFAQKGLKVAETNAADAMDIDDDDDDDDDWDPTMRGSASPKPMPDDDQESEEDNDENMYVEQDVDVNTQELDEDDVGQSKVCSTRRMVITSDSEGENDENKAVAPESNPRRRATSSVDSVAEDEYDKENNNDLMYDHGDDKENTAVVRHTPLGRTRSIFDVGMPLSPSNDWSARSQRSELDNTNDDNIRRPFQDLLSDKSPLTKGQSSRLTQSFAVKLQQASPLPSTLVPAPTLKPFLNSSLHTSEGFDGFSQFSEGGESEDIGQVSILEPGFSDLFESGTERQQLPNKVDKGKARLTEGDIFFGNNNPGQLKWAGALNLTQDVSVALNLQPAFRAKEDLVRKADAIFEKEQAFVVEAALPKPNKKPELYVNDHGFLTQTRPTDGSPEIYRPPSTQQLKSSSMGGSTLSPSGFRSRTPLRTLSVSSAYLPDSPTQQPLRRLKKTASPTPRLDSVFYLPSTTPPPRQNAFQVLAQGAVKAHKHAGPEHARPGLDLAEYLEDEAAESDDEDNAFGFRKKNTADEEDGEDLDQTLTELMDDKEMDESMIAADRVLQKFQEQEQEQDQKDEELHKAAISGILRKKRTRGVGVDDSDEESDDEGNERARRAMKKLRTTDRGDIQALAADEATEAFAAVYNQSLKDDDDFAYLATESNLDDLIDVNHEAENNDSDGYEEEEEQVTISPQEVMRIARRMKEDGAEETGIDPEDVSWVDIDKDIKDDALSIKTFRAPKPQRISQQDIDALGMGGTMGRPPGKAEQLNSWSKQWYAQENKSRNAGTSRSVEGSAITGHAKVKSKTGATTSHEEVQRTKGGATSASAGPNKSVKAERSLLSVIADKSRHFA